MNPPSLTIDNMPAITQPHVALVANQVQAAAAPQNTRRNGKIARLPKPARDLVNRMLDDGLPARVIIDELGQAGEGLNPQNITNWVQGGYQDYLKAQEDFQRAKTQVEAAFELLKESPDLSSRSVRQATDLVAALQLFQVIRDYGEEALQQMFQTSPAKYLPVVNTLCRMSNLELRRGKQNLAGTFLSSCIKPNQAPEFSTANCYSPLSAKPAENQTQSS